MSRQNFQPLLECYYDLSWAHGQVLLFQLLEYHQLTALVLDSN